MKLITEVRLPHYNFEIKYSDQLFFIGSCFSNEISKKFKAFSYHLTANPFGTVYHSRAIRHQIDSLTNSHFDLDQWMIENEKEWISLLHNTDYRSQDRMVLYENIQIQLEKARVALQNCNYLFLTLGTASVYRYKENNLVVANCQKLSRTSFDRELMSVAEILNDLNVMKEMVHKQNPNCKFIITVSPVRHLKDGFVANQQSKARLILATHAFSNQTDVDYFPSYEIALDELRDYRFYASDMVHLNELGINYIWEKVNCALLAQKEEPIRKAVNQLRKLQHHRVVDASKRKEHELRIEAKRKEIKERYHIDLFE